MQSIFISLLKNAISKLKALNHHQIIQKTVDHINQTSLDL